ncbi:DUF262 domain-containing protein [Pedococcus cremeus]|nr:DUF262 domain-containing protein [Pedococcus cremeus]
MNRLLDALDLDETEVPASIRVANPLGIGKSEAHQMTGVDTEIERRIADAIADLSSTEQAPSGFSDNRVEVRSGAVDFADGSWRTGLVEVVEWLHLDEELNQESDEAFDRSLAEALELEPRQGAAGLPAPDGSSLLQRLAERLDRAVDFRNAFIEEVAKIDEGTATLESATGVWADKWEEVSEEDEVEGSGPIHAEATTWTISDFVGYAENAELNLSPSFQRADVWVTTMSQQLIESVLRGIPLPSVIILERVDLEAGTTAYEVVDGKQRLTALLRFTGCHPVALEEVRKRAVEWEIPDLLNTFQRDYPEFKKIWKKRSPEALTATLERESYFPFPLRSGEVKPLSGALAALRGKYYCQVRDVKIPVLGVPRAVSYVFEKSSADYRLPVITYKQVSDEQIHEVFSLYNKQGKHLNAEEIRNALYHHLAFMKALVVTAGDSGNVKDDATFLQSEWHDLQSTQTILNGYGFPRAGYKRTKLLSWVSAALFLPGEALPGRSTTNHINALLKRISDDKTDRLRDQATVLKAMVVLDKGLDAHAAIGQEIWSKTFVNSRGTGKWQELQLVSSLIALSAAHVVRGDALVDELEDKFSEIQKASAKWVRPRKSQSKDQWEFIARVVCELLALLQVDIADVDDKLTSDFGASGLGDLVSVHTG